MDVVCVNFRLCDRSCLSVQHSCNHTHNFTFIMAKFAIEMDEVQQISENNVLYLCTFYSFRGQ
jgi:predicted Kef-type K+ transport protein